MGARAFTHGCVWGLVCARLCCCVSQSVGPAAAPRRGSGARLGSVVTRGAGRGASGVWPGDGVLDRLATPLQAGRILGQFYGKGGVVIVIVVVCFVVILP